jgi:hypothetical protein
MPEQALGPLAELVHARGSAPAVRWRCPTARAARRAAMRAGRVAAVRFELAWRRWSRAARMVGFAGSAVDVTERWAGAARLRSSWPSTSC